MSKPLSPTVLRRTLLLALAAAFLPLALSAQPPAGYYNGTSGLTGSALRSAVHDIIDDHTRFPYTASSTDVWDILSAADEDPGNSANVVTIYINESRVKTSTGTGATWNREHTWPSSYGFTDDISCNYPFTDTHMLRPADASTNSARSNEYFDNCISGCTLYPATGTSFSNESDSDSWEVWEGRRGDIARAMFYMDVRYEGGTHGLTGCPEPDLILTDDPGQITAFSTNQSVAYMGLLSVLIQWHLEDPVDAEELARNDIIFGFQGNRNPFVDNPQWVCDIYGATGCGGGGGDTTPPAIPAGLVATAGSGSVSLDWADNGEADLAGYNIYRATSSGGPYTKLNTLLATTSDYTDTTVTGGTTYYYVVSAVDTSANESAFSGEASATPTGGGGGTPGVVWINELHYDNDGTDTGEFVEVAGGAGTDLTGWSIVLYNGNGGGSYATLSLSGTLADQQGGFGTATVNAPGIQNGSPDGLALVDDQGNVVQFLSYEGVITAADGPAAGLTSTDIGVSETTSTPIGLSLQLTGTGSSYADFTWAAPAAETPGQPNNNQTFSGGGGDTTPPAAPVNLVATAGDSTVTLDWSDNTEPDLASYTLYRSTTAGGPYTAIQTGLTSSGATDTTVTNGVTYYYVVTATDTSSNESAFSGEAAAQPDAGGGTSPVVAWINEIHYDNSGADANEGVEIAGTAGLDLAGWSIIGYNGSNFSVYDTVNLSGVLPDQQNGFGTLWFPISGLQNGSPDGIALIDDQGEVVLFLSYEGTFTAADGPAAGQTSTDIGVSESASTLSTESLQLSGTGGSYGDFTWIAPSASTAGAPNIGQTFQSTPLLINLVSLTADALDDWSVEIRWETSLEIDNAGFHIWRVTERFGSVQMDERLTLSLLPAEGSDLSGATYSFIDPEPVQPGEVRAYVLEDVDFNGTSTLHGPASLSRPEPLSASVPDWAVYP